MSDINNYQRKRFGSIYARNASSKKKTSKDREEPRERIFNKPECYINDVVQLHKALRRFLDKMPGRIYSHSYYYESALELNPEEAKKFVTWKIIPLIPNWREKDIRILRYCSKLFQFQNEYEFYDDRCPSSTILVDITDGLAFALDDVVICDFKKWTSDTKVGIKWAAWIKSLSNGKYAIVKVRSISGLFKRLGMVTIAYLLSIDNSWLISAD